MPLESVCGASSFPFPSALPFTDKDRKCNARLQKKMTSQILNFYTYCKQNFCSPLYLDKQVHGKCESRILRIDFDDKKIEWKNADNSSSVRLVALKISEVFLSRTYGVSSFHRWQFLFHGSSGRSIESFWLAKNEIPLTLLHLRYFDGNQIEVVYKNFDPLKRIESHKEEDFWTRENNRLIYRSLFLDAMTNVYMQQARPLKIALLGEKEGDLYSRLNQMPFVERLTLSINDQTSWKIAEDRLKEDCCTGEHRKEIEIENHLMSDNCPTLKSFDAIILSEIAAPPALAREDAHALILKCKEALTEGGYLLVGSYFPPFFSRKDYVKMGFTVLNTAGFVMTSDLPWQEAREAGDWSIRPEPFYVLRKDGSF